MKLVKARVRGLGLVIETKWFELSPRLNLFHFADSNKGGRFLQTLQTINPPFSCEAIAPFSDFPEHILWHGFHRHVIPEKRTVAIGVFGAHSDLVVDLAGISPLLFETDRIEVGRRLDYSRWINFVELASSTRWSELEPDLTGFLHRIREILPEHSRKLEEFTADFHPSDRIKKERGDGLKALLKNLQNQTPAEMVAELENIREKVMRADFFTSARQEVYRRLPLFVFINSDGSATYCPSGYRTGDAGSDELELLVKEKNLTEEMQPAETKKHSVIERMGNVIERGGRLSHLLFQTGPILLFHCPGRGMERKELEQLIALLREASAKCQCLCVTDDKTLFESFPADMHTADKDLVL